MNAYNVKFITDYVVLITTANAEDEEQAESFALETLAQELGVTLTNYEIEIELEGEIELWDVSNAVTQAPTSLAGIAQGAGRTNSVMMPI